VRTCEYHAPYDAARVGVAASALAPGARAGARVRPSFIIGTTSDALHPDVAYSVIDVCVQQECDALWVVARNMQKDRAKRKEGVSDE